jgi:hypothetical protein
MGLSDFELVRQLVGAPDMTSRRTGLWSDRGDLWPTGLCVTALAVMSKDPALRSKLGTQPMTGVVGSSFNETSGSTWSPIAMCSSTGRVVSHRAHDLIALSLWFASAQTCSAINRNFAGKEKAIHLALTWLRTKLILPNSAWDPNPR